MLHNCLSFLMYVFAVVIGYIFYISVLMQHNCLLIVCLSFLLHVFAVVIGYIFYISVLMHFSCMYLQLS